MHSPLHRFEKIDVVKGSIYGAVIDLIVMYGLWPATGQELPTIPQAIVMVFGGMGIGLLIVFLAKVRKSRKGWKKYV